MAKGQLQNVGEALAQAKEERDETKTAEERKRVTSEQIAEALIGIRWAAVGIMSELIKRK